MHRSEAHSEDKMNPVSIGTGELYIPTHEDIGHKIFLYVTTNTYNPNATLIVQFKKVWSAEGWIHTMDNRLPPPRCMIKLEDGNPPPPLFKVMTFNVMSPSSGDDRAIRGDHYCPIWALGVMYRYTHILKEIDRLDPNLLCLQEIQRSNFQAFMFDELDRRGYVALTSYKPNDMDGCCIAFKTSEFRIVKIQPVRFSQLANADFKNIPQARQLCCKASVGLIVNLQYKPEKKEICMVNLHFSAHNYKAARVYQALRLTRLLEPHASLPIIICGDFNEPPSSNIHRFMKEGAADFPLGVDRTHFHNISPYKLSHKLNKLESSYGAASSSTGVNAKALQSRMYLREPLFTFGRLEKLMTLDYIYFSPQKLKCTEVLDLWSIGQMKKPQGLPHPEHPSDHTSLMAHFTWATV